MNEKVKYSIQNLEAAFDKLSEYLSLPIENDRDRAGIIKAFEFTFELARKTFQKIAVDEGLEIGGPKTALKHAFKLNIIINEEESTWLQMLNDRNLMSHTYREKLSHEVVNRIQKNYVSSFSKVLGGLKARFQP